MDETEHRDLVRQRYAAIATDRAEQPGGGACCGAPNPDDRARRMGYADAELAAAPTGANLGLGCGNPHAISALRPGEAVLDLGSGAGFDCFLAARQVGETGKVIGVDMTPEMLAKAQRNAAEAGLSNVEFRLGEIERLPVDDASIDAVISNCVVNLSADKPQVFRETFRVLKPGGRLAISDVVALKPQPAVLADDPAMLCGCVAGAARSDEIASWLRQAGFVDVRIEEKEESRDLIKDWAPGRGVEDFVVSAMIAARKPETLTEGENAMKKLEIYDPAMCCATGVCGPEVDPALVAFAADLKWAAEQGVEVRRYNLGQEPQAFAANPDVVKEMEAGMDRLPIIALDGRIISTGVYLSRDQLVAKLGLAKKPQVAVKAEGGSCRPSKSGCC